jgi:hypothetical protein
VAEDLDESPVARLACVGSDNTVMRVVLSAGAG